jgi:hypothetical protein
MVACRFGPELVSSPPLGIPTRWSEGLRAARPARARRPSNVLAVDTGWGLSKPETSTRRERQAARGRPLRYLPQSNGADLRSEAAHTNHDRQGPRGRSSPGVVVGPTPSAVIHCVAWSRVRRAVRVPAGAGCHEPSRPHLRKTDSQGRRASWPLSNASQVRYPLGTLPTLPLLI